MNINQIFTGKSKKRNSKEDNLDSLKKNFSNKINALKKIIKNHATVMDELDKIEKTKNSHNCHPLQELQESFEFLSQKVLGMIESLEIIAPEKYPELIEQYEDIINANARFLPEYINSNNNFTRIIPLEKADLYPVSKSGYKLYNLSKLKKELGLTIPRGFIISSDSYKEFIEYNNIEIKIKELIRDIINNEDLCKKTKEIRKIIINGEIPNILSNEILDACTDLINQEGISYLAMRSSAVFEDLKGASFAGLYKTKLNITPDKILNSYKSILAGQYSFESVKYRMDKGLLNTNELISVGCMEMIDASSGGVVYTKSPIDLSNDHLFISSCKGLPKTVVDGREETDCFKVLKHPPHEIIYRKKGSQNNFYRCSSIGVKLEKISSENKKELSLKTHEAVDLAKKATLMEKLFNYPQDIEWAKDVQGNFFFLQSRPLSIRALTSCDYMPNKKKAKLKSGQTVSPGTCTGKIAKLKDPKDLSTIQENTIVVVNQALPLWAGGLTKAKGLICEHGGLACHLANIARELNIPAVMNVENAMKHLLNDETITLDADSRQIFSGKIESLLTKDAKKIKNISTTEDNRKAFLYKAVQPVSYKNNHCLFKLDNNSSLYDIAKFIQEKSGIELFTQLKQTPLFSNLNRLFFIKHSVKWQVIDLDNGMKTAKSKYMSEKEILSIPMKAFLDGFTAIKWEGVLNSRISEMSPAFTNIIHSINSEKSQNHHQVGQNETAVFMTTKNFCLLKSRSDYQFSYLEAVVGKKSAGNYAKFFFSGGKADKPGREKRIKFLNNILQSQGFVTTAFEDQITAKTEKRNKKDMIKAIKALGYINLHSKDLDMILKNPDVYLNCSNKFRYDLTKLGAA